MRYILLSVLNTIWLGQEVQGPRPLAKFYRCGLKMWAYGPKNRQIGNFWYKFAPNGKRLGSIEKQI